MKKLMMLIALYSCSLSSYAQKPVKKIDFYDVQMKSGEIFGNKRNYFNPPKASKQHLVSLKQAIPVKSDFSYLGDMFSWDLPAKNISFLRNVTDYNSVSLVDSIKISYLSSNGIYLLDSIVASLDIEKFKSQLISNKYNYLYKKQLLDSIKYRQYRNQLDELLYEKSTPVKFNLSKKVSKQLTAKIVANLEDKINNIANTSVHLDASIGNSVSKNIIFDAFYYNVQLNDQYIQHIKFYLKNYYKKNKEKMFSESSNPSEEAIKEFLGGKEYSIICYTTIMEADYKFDKDSNLTSDVLATIQANIPSEIFDNNKDKISLAVNAAFKSEMAKSLDITTKSRYLLGFGIDERLEVGAGSSAAR